MRSNLGQATIFIILGIIIVALVIVFISYRTSNNISKVPASLEEPYEGFLSCIADEAWLGIRILETQGGYIDLPEFEPGSP